MPKQISDVREKLLNACSELLYTKGYRGVSIRAVADCCGIAVGTVYNYFPSKDQLIAGVLLQNWSSVHQRLLEEAQVDPDCEHAFRSLFEELRTFSVRYRVIWTEYQGLAPAYPFSKHALDWHNQFVDQISEITTILCRRFARDNPPYLATFIAKNLQYASVYSTVSFDTAWPVLRKLL